MNLSIGRHNAIAWLTLFAIRSRCQNSWVSDSPRRLMFNLQCDRPRGPMTSIAFAVAIGVGAAIVAAASPAFSMIAPPSVIPQFNIQRESVTRANVYPQSSRRLAQDSDDNTDSGVPPDQVEKYVAVYKDMQRD